METTSLDGWPDARGYIISPLGGWHCHFLYDGGMIYDLLAQAPFLGPVLTAVTAVAFVLALVLWVRVHAFLALLIASYYVGIVSGMEVQQINESIKTGMGGILGFVATVVGLGAIFGKLLEAGGGAEALASSMLRRFGERRASWAMVITGFLVSIPVFFDVALVILIPLVYALTRKSGKPVLHFAIPLLAGIAVTHAFVPPTPGPILVAEQLGASLGLVILWGIAIGIPTAIVAGPIFGSFIAKRIPKGIPDEFVDVEAVSWDESALPSFPRVCFVIFVPIALILFQAVVTEVFEVTAGNSLLQWLCFFGHPFVALLLGILLAAILITRRQGYSRDAMMDLCSKALTPTGIIILVTGAGGVFKQVLIDSQVADVLAQRMMGSSMNIVALAFLISAMVRIAQGSATVAMVTAAAFVAPLIPAMSSLSSHDLALITISIASGATAFSHVNDSGFWLVAKFLGLSEKETLLSWSVMGTIVGLFGFVLALILSAFV